MPRAKQKDPVEAHDAEVAVPARANGATRTSKGAATASKGPQKAESKPATKASTKAGPVAKRTAPKQANGAPGVVPKPQLSPKPASTTAKAEKPKPAKAVRDQKTSGPDGHSVAQDTSGDDDEPRDVFLSRQRVLLMAERNNYTRQAEELRAQAEALALEHEPGDVQFDEEGGEGGTANVDRELDLHLSAQASAAIEEIDAALVKISEGTYGFCESCGNPVPKARLEALPHARLCVSCKSGGLSARRQ